MASKDKKRGAGFLVAAIFAVIAFAITLVLAFTLLKTTTYYAVGRDVQAREQITADMLIPITVSDGGQPYTAYTKEQIEAKPIWAKIDLQKGEPLTVSNSGDLERVNESIPANFVTASLTVPPENANLGEILPGDHINIYYISDDTDTREARLVMQNLLVVSAGQDAATAIMKTDEKGEAQPNQSFQVAVSVENAANLAILNADSSNLYITLTPADGAVSKPVVSMPLDTLKGAAPDASLDAKEAPKKNPKEKGKSNDSDIEEE